MRKSGLWSGKNGIVGHSWNVFPVTFGSVYVFPSLARLFVRDSSRRNEALQWAMAGLAATVMIDLELGLLDSLGGETAVYLVLSRSNNVNRRGLWIVYLKSRGSILFNCSAKSLGTMHVFSGQSGLMRRREKRWRERHCPKVCPICDIALRAFFLQLDNSLVSALQHCDQLRRPPLSGAYIKSMFPPNHNIIIGGT